MLKRLRMLIMTMWASPRSRFWPPPRGTVIHNADTDELQVFDGNDWLIVPKNLT